MNILQIEKGPVKWLLIGTAAYDIYEHFKDRMHDLFNPDVPVIPIHNPDEFSSPNY